VRLSNATARKSVQISGNQDATYFSEGGFLYGTILTARELSPLDQGEP
jgi:hypothetical protein